ncbi:permease-like cell division protein FtsX [Patescibacteria group bacterium]|nr:permease-like cell division protein FtsX [Patescibacteria group bacterium]
MRSFFRMIKFAAQSILRNFWLSVATTTVFLLTLITINAVLILNVMADAAIESIEDRIQVEIYFNPGTSAEVQASMRGYLVALPEVRDIKVIPAEDALESFKERHANDPEILAALEEVGGNPLGDALRVFPRSPEDFDVLLQAVDSPEFAPYIREKDYDDYIGTMALLSEFTARIRIGGLILAGFFAAISALIVFNSMRVAIYVHRDEIAVMKLVGAKDWFVRGPFFMEAIFYSAAATGLMALVLFGLLQSLEPTIQAFFAGVPVELSAFYLQNAIVIFGGQFIALVILGVGTTILAMRRYLRV